MIEIVPALPLMLKESLAWHLGCSGLIKNCQMTSQGNHHRGRRVQSEGKRWDRIWMSGTHNDGGKKQTLMFVKVDCAEEWPGRIC